ncbi:hypothetical protein DICPUDRAFT_150846 [Dictyostelium purpureum]|uniref:non-specific serine/threonine protein kinase n=1 Tax=Dictyostelium purpureum TaxID=5786 RepID=F0ZHE3_DICPU|nr:uncharacterized protein DICPUDRAFT_150846 [Dictyostelium purpureum]EGC36669.1 hypothetical protein DICPUDRAFT_150846 [Dictyostelium purpureum]|eukprot:XP_003286837.1 hypothetical protein DICPUDRAFT_150846 [Dictyostelium purpureum]
MSQPTPINNSGNGSKESLLQKVMKSPSTQNLLNQIHLSKDLNNSSSSVGVSSSTNSQSHPPNHSPPSPPKVTINKSISGDSSDSLIDNSGEPNSHPPNYTPPVPPKNSNRANSTTLSDNESFEDSSNNNGHNPVMRTESSISIISNSSSGSASNDNQPINNQNLQRHSSNISMNTTDDSAEMDSLSTSMSSEFTDINLVGASDSGTLVGSSTTADLTTSTNTTPNNKKLTRKLAQFISSPKLLNSITSLPNTPTHLPNQENANSASCESSPGLISPRGSISNPSTSANNTPTIEKEKKKKKFLKKPDIFKSHKHSVDPAATATNESHGNGSLSPSSTSTNLSASSSDKKSHKKSHKKTKSTFDINTEISIPYNVIHKMHVDFDLKWTGHNDFKLDEKLGDGAYGSVYKGTHKDLGFTLAIKVIEMKESESQSLQNEINILKNCKSPNVVSYYGSLQHEDNVWILMDFCALGSIRDIIESTEKTLNESQISFVVKNTLKGLIYLHKQNIVHRDVKAANILLGEDCQVKIADFGVSEKLNGASQSKEMIGTPLWMAPEVILKKNYDYKADVWSLGITIIEMADGLPPHMDMNPMRAMKMVPIWPPPTFLEPKKWSPLLNDFLARCLNKDPEKRSSPIDLLCHPFLRKERSPEVLGDLVNQLFRIKKKKHDELKKQQKHSTVNSTANSNSDVDNSTETNGLGNDSYIPIDPSSVKLATVNIGTFNFKGNYTTCNEFDDDEEKNTEDVHEDDEEDEDVDPFSTTVFHGPKGIPVVTEEDDEDEDEDEDDEEEEDDDDEEISASGTMVRKKKKPSKQKKLPKSSSNNSNSGLHTPPSKSLPLLPPTLSNSNSSLFNVQTDFKALESKLVSYIDSSNKTLIQDIREDVKALENSIVSKLGKELALINLNFQQQLQQSLSPIISSLEELKKQQQQSQTQQHSQQSNSSFQPSSKQVSGDKKSVPMLSRQTSFKNSNGVSTASPSSSPSPSPSPSTLSTNVKLSSSPSSSTSIESQTQSPVSILRKSSTFVKPVVDDNVLSTSPNTNPTGRASPSVMKRFATLSSSGDSVLNNANIEKKPYDEELLNSMNPLVKDKVKMFETDTGNPTNNNNSNSNNGSTTPPLTPTLTSSVNNSNNNCNKK